MNTTSIVIIMNLTTRNNQTNISSQTRTRTHRDGYVARFTTQELKSTSRTSRGVRSITLREGDRMADMDTLKSSTVQLLRSSAVGGAGGADNGELIMDAVLNLVDQTSSVIYSKCDIHLYVIVFV